eukprot:1524176-Rhodomonas_salina.1
MPELPRQASIADEYGDIHRCIETHRQPRSAPCVLALVGSYIKLVPGSASHARRQIAGRDTGSVPVSASHAHRQIADRV